MIKINLSSDNCSPVHPDIMTAIVDANRGNAAAYGGDEWTKQAEAVIQKAFENDCKVVFVPTGTGSNVLALKIACQRHESVICTDIAHINCKETGAAESIIGCKLLTIPHQEGKLTEITVRELLKLERGSGRHSTHPRILSISQPTEVGTLYSLEELKILGQLCQEENLLFHMDGSRFYNAAAAFPCNLQAMTTGINLDVLSLGGTKNGLMFAEAVVIFNCSLKIAADYLQKQTLQLMSKMRYLAAQYIPFFEKKLWFDLAIQANLRAKELAQAFESIPGLKLSYPVQTNQLFITVPKSWNVTFQDKISCMVWNNEKNEIRLITSWNTSKEEIEKVKAILLALC